VRRVARLLWLAPACLVAAGLTACGSGPGAQVTVVKVKEADFRIVASPQRIRAGDIELVSRNAGPDDHELIVVRARRRSLPLRADDLTVNEEQLEPHTVGVLEPGPPGSVRKLRLHLEPGSYELFCNMAGHYLGGMRAFLVVT